MRIKSLQLKNFKRFTDLTLQDIPESAKLVLLIGSNGSGKSSVFDAFSFSSEDSKVGQESHGTTLKGYYSKLQTEKTEVNITTTQGSLGRYFEPKTLGIVSSFSGDKDVSAKNFYGRSAFRYFPNLSKTSYETGFLIEQDIDRPKLFIDVDNRFQNDVDIIMDEVVRVIFVDIEEGEQRLSRIKNFLSRINNSLVRIFGDKPATSLSLKSILPPSGGRPIQLLFTKGKSEIHYNVLSGGEKEVINLIFNLYTRTPYFDDTIYFIDEMDSHLNTSLQYNLLKEITENWIPDNCQLWTASHSLGFIDYANDSSHAAIIDFDDLDFDLPQELRPTPKNNAEVFELAVSKEFIDKLLKDRKVYFAENTDAQLYNNLAFTNTFFFIANNKLDVFHKARNFNQLGIIDRDYLSDEEVSEIRRVYSMLYVLPYYSIENLLYHPDNLEEYFGRVNKSFNKEAYTRNILDIKNEEKDSLLLGISQARNGYPFFKENEHAKKLKSFKENSKSIAELLRSNDLEVFYKVFPAKDIGKRIKERQNIAPAELAKTNWFKTQIEKILNEPN